MQKILRLVAVLTLAGCVTEVRTVREVEVVSELDAGPDAAPPAAPLDASPAPDDASPEAPRGVSDVGAAPSDTTAPSDTAPPDTSPPAPEAAPPPPSCPAGETMCPSGCSNTLNDPNNCGGCGIVCADGGACLAATPEMQGSCPTPLSCWYVGECTVSSAESQFQCTGVYVPVPGCGRIGSNGLDAVLCCSTGITPP